MRFRTRIYQAVADAVLAAGDWTVSLQGVNHDGTLEGVSDTYDCIPPVAPDTIPVRTGDRVIVVLSADGYRVAYKVGPDAPGETPEERKRRECILEQVYTWVQEMRQDWPSGPLDTEVWCPYNGTVMQYDASTDEPISIIVTDGQFGEITGSVRAIDQTTGETITLILDEGLVTNYATLPVYINLFLPATGDAQTIKLVDGYAYYKQS
jgi:hypothetical protein